VFAQKLQIAEPAKDVVCHMIMIAVKMKVGAEYQWAHVAKILDGCVVQMMIDTAV